MRVLVISNNYPSPQMPSKGVFVYNLIQLLAGWHDITVISPMKIQDSFRKNVSYGNERCMVYRPIYFSSGNKTFFGFDFAKLSFRLLKQAVNKILKKKKIKVDLIYSHFFINGAVVHEYAAKYNIPLVVASGESSIQSISFLDDKSALRKFIERIDHVIAVSDKNYQFSKMLGVAPERIDIIPNAANLEVFFPQDVGECKRKLGVDGGKFVVGYIGHFIHRKGLLRVIEAIELLQNKDIILICVGSGDSFEQKSFIKHILPVPNSKLPDIINAFDIFVLPTLSEGHCNAIEEVKACGIPVISSKGTTVENQIDESNGILVDPEDINEISFAIHSLLSDGNKREQMRENLIKQRIGNPLELRAKAINNIFHQIQKEYVLQN